jgi:hypothetical protein
LLGVSLSPCCRSHPARVVRRVSQCATAHAAFTFPVAGSASGAAHVRGHRCVRLRYRLETRHHPAEGVVERLQEVGFPAPCAPSYRTLAFPLVGLPPTEHARLSWTHNRTCPSLGIRLSILEFLLSVALAGDFRHCPQCLTCSCRQPSRVLTVAYLWPLGRSPFPSAWGLRLCYHRLYLG